MDDCEDALYTHTHTGWTFQHLSLGMDWQHVLYRSLFSSLVGFGDMLNVIIGIQYSLQ